MGNHGSQRITCNFNALDFIQLTAIAPDIAAGPDIQE
jgi:hypothetical protein